MVYLIRFLYIHDIYTKKKVHTKYILNIYRIINIISRIINVILHIHYSPTIALSNLKIAQLRVKGITESSISLTTFTFLYSTFNQIREITKITKFYSMNWKWYFIERKFFQSSRLHQFIEMGVKRRSMIHNTIRNLSTTCNTIHWTRLKKKNQLSVKGRNIDEGTLSSCRFAAWKSRFFSESHRRELCRKRRRSIPGSICLITCKLPLRSSQVVKVKKREMKYRGKRLYMTYDVVNDDSTMNNEKEINENVRAWDVCSNKFDV